MLDIKAVHHEFLEQLYSPDADGSMNEAKRLLGINDSVIESITWEGKMYASQGQAKDLVGGMFLAGVLFGLYYAQRAQGELLCKDTLH